MGITVSSAKEFDDYPQIKPQAKDIWNLLKQLWSKAMLFYDRGEKIHRTTKTNYTPVQKELP